MSGHTGQVPDTLDRRGDWIHQGLCRHEDPKLFFAAARVQDAKRVCVVCPVLGDCHRWVMGAESGLGEDWRDGVVAALTAGERAALDPIARARAARLAEKKRAQAAAAVAVVHEPKPEPSPEPAPEPEPAPAPKPKLVPKPAPKPAPKPRPRPRPRPKRKPTPAPEPRRTKRLATCPSNSAYLRHVSRGEPIDDGCRAAHAQAKRAANYSRQERAVYAPWSRGLSDAAIAAATGLAPVVVRRTRARLGLMPNNPKATS